MSALPSPLRPQLGPLLAQSWATMRAHPVIVAALGGAVLLGLASILFGVGIFATPWFACELFALQLAVLTGRPPKRGASWVRAGVLVLGLVSIAFAATWLAALVLGPDLATADAARDPLPWPEAIARVAAIAFVAALAVGFIAPFAYAPLILIERGGRIGEAVVESAWLVRRGGLLRHWALVFLAHMLPLLPALVSAVVVARTFERAATPVGVLLAVPLLPFSIPFGQGLLTAAYVERRRELSEPRWTRAESRPPAALVALLSVVVLAPMASVVCVALAATRPAPPTHGRATGTIVVTRTIDAPTTLHVPDTTLAVQVDGRALSVRSGDGGGVGELTSAWRGAIRRLRVRRDGDVYGIEARAEDGWWHARVDRAGMRVDDEVGVRLERRLPRWTLPAIALSFALTALLAVSALAPLGTLRRAYGEPADRRAPRAELRALRRATFRRTTWVALGLAPPALAALAGGLFGWLG